MATSKKAVAPPAPNEVEPKNNVMILSFDNETKELFKELISAIKNAPAPIINLTTQQILPTASNSTSNVPAIETPSATALGAQTSPKQAKLFEEPKPEAVTVSLTSIREMINLKAGEGKTQAIVKLLGDHGAKNASTLAEDKFDSFYQALKDI